MGTHGQKLPHPLPAAAAILRGERRGDRFHSLGGPRRRARENTTDGVPSCVVDGRVEAGCAAGPIVLIATVAVRLCLGPAAEVTRLEVFSIDQVVLTDQRTGGLVVTVSPLALALLILLGALPHGFPPALTALLAPRHATLGRLQPLLGCAMIPWVLHLFPARRHQECFQPHVDARLFTGEGQRFDVHLGTRAAGIPPVRLPGDRDGLGCAFQLPMEPDRDTPDLRLVLLPCRDSTTTLVFCADLNKAGTLSRESW
jgi:hypothetical protein